MQQANVLIYFISFSIGAITVGALIAQGLKERKKEWNGFILFFVSFGLIILSDLITHFHQILLIKQQAKQLLLNPILSSLGLHLMIIFAPLYSHKMVELPNAKKRNLFFIVLSLSLLFLPLLLFFTEAFSLEGIGFFIIGPVLLYCFIICIKKYPFDQSNSVKRTFRLWLLFLSGLILALLYEFLMGQILQHSSAETGFTLHFYREKTLYPGIFILFGILYFINALASLGNKEQAQRISESIEYPSSLTEREKEVLQLVLEGKNNSEISESLFISIGTVKAHLTKVFQKTNTKSRVQLITLFQNRIS